MRIEIPRIGEPTSTKASCSAVESNEKLFEKVMAEEVSDIPHAGRIALAGSPWGQSNSKKRLAVLATIASPAFKINRIEDRFQCCD